MQRLKTFFALKLTFCMLSIFSGFQAYFSINESLAGDESPFSSEGGLLGWVLTTEVLLAFQLAFIAFSINFRDLTCHLVVLGCNCALFLLNLCSWICLWPPELLWSYGLPLAYDNKSCRSCNGGAHYCILATILDFKVSR